MSVASVSREAWVAWLLALDGTKYQHQGRLPGVALDCIGPVIVGARHFGLVAPSFDLTGYSPAPDGSLQPQLDAYLERKPREALTLGDLVLNGYRLGPPRHIAVIVGEQYGQWVLLHANGDTGRVQIERIQYERRYYRFVQGYQVPGVGE